MGLTFADCQGLGAFMSLGFVQAGFKMKVKTGTLDFGLKLADANRHLLGDDWEAFHSADAAAWPLQHVDAVVGCPPCSGWSVWTGGGADGKNRGPEAAAHAHTREFMRYAARVKPRAIVFECVQQAYTQGRATMLEYRAQVEELSGQEYDLYHVKMNNLMVGGYSYRPRYFWVAVERGMPFGVEAIWPEKLPTIMDVIGDLQDLPQTWEKQPYRWPRNEWTASMESKSGLVDGHVGRNNLHSERIADIFEALGGNDEWDSGKSLGAALKDCYDKNDCLPPSWKNKQDKIVENGFDIGFSQPYRWRNDKWANVLTGGALDLVIHPTRPRCITHREAARMQGLPDDWVIRPAREYSPLQSVWGKAVAVHAGKWIGDWVGRSLEGKPGPQTGTLIGDREWMVETDTGFSRPAVTKRYYPTAGSGVTRIYNAERWEKDKTPVPVPVVDPALVPGLEETPQVEPLVEEFIEPAPLTPPAVIEEVITDISQPSVPPVVSDKLCNEDRFTVGDQVMGVDGIVGVIQKLKGDGYAVVRLDAGGTKTRSLKKLAFV
jgi:site-specific DNA-cytosine methylase